MDPVNASALLTVILTEYQRQGHRQGQDAGRFVSAESMAAWPSWPWFTGAGRPCHTLPLERSRREDFAAFFDGIGAVGLEVFEGIVLAAGPVYFD